MSKRKPRPVSEMPPRPTEFGFGFTLGGIVGGIVIAIVMSFWTTNNERLAINALKAEKEHSALLQSTLTGCQTIGDLLSKRLMQEHTNKWRFQQ